ncbi:hypothetical protein F4805DRAFT_475693 [Annulohypoxylon moriforme]|nr:hypothetical protein F4805DRAFT_475693 [Annulohypoxylon moriforme]
MATSMATSNSIATTSTAVELTEPKAPASAAKTVIWGLTYNGSFKNMIGEKVSAKRGAEPDPPAPDPPAPGSPVPDSSASEDAEPQPTVETRVTVTYPRRKVIELPPGVTEFDIPMDGIHVSIKHKSINPKRGATRKGGSSTKPAGHSRKKSKSQDGEKSSKKGGQPRISTKNHLQWVPITQNGQPYTHLTAGSIELPVSQSSATPCDVENDIFIMDRNVLSSLVRPKGCDQAHAIDIYRDKENYRAQKARDLLKKDSAVLKFKNVALNVNDMGSILVYFDLLARAELRSDFDDFGNRTITFFSVPNYCDHDDCAPLQTYADKQYRTAGAKCIAKQHWWHFADFCFHDASTITFRDWAHPRDPTLGLTLEEASQVRTWYHALLNHPIRPNEEGVRRTQFVVFHWRGIELRDDGSGKFRHLVDSNSDCTNATRATDDRQGIPACIDPEVTTCLFCEGTGFGLEHFTMTPVPKSEDTGLMYLHYTEDAEHNKVQEEEPDMSKGKGKEVANYSLGNGEGSSANAGAGDNVEEENDPSDGEESGGENGGDSAGVGKENVVDSAVASTDDAKIDTADTVDTTGLFDESLD